MKTILIFSLLFLTNTINASGELDQNEINMNEMGQMVDAAAQVVTIGHENDLSIIQAQALEKYLLITQMQIDAFGTQLQIIEDNQQVLGFLYQNNESEEDIIKVERKFNAFIEGEFLTLDQNNFPVFSSQMGESINSFKIILDSDLFWFQPHYVLLWMLNEKQLFDYEQEKTKFIYAQQRKKDRALRCLDIINHIRTPTSYEKRKAYLSMQVENKNIDESYMNILLQAQDNWKEDIDFCQGSIRDIDQLLSDLAAYQLEGNFDFVTENDIRFAKICFKIGFFDPLSSLMDTKIGTILDYI